MAKPSAAFTSRIASAGQVRFRWAPALRNSQGSPNACVKLSTRAISPCRSRAALQAKKWRGRSRIWLTRRSFCISTNMNLSLKDRVALVAGSSRGIGRAIAAELLAEGCRVCLTGRDEASLGKAYGELVSEYGDERVLKFRADFTDLGTAKQAIDAILARWGSLHLLIANVGSGKGRAGWDIGSGEWHRIFAENLFASVWLAQSAIPAMSGGSGSIVFISSICAVEATPAPLPYSAAKAALNNYAKNL